MVVAEAEVGYYMEMGHLLGSLYLFLFLFLFLCPCLYLCLCLQRPST
jgi:hypothetical protein